MSGKPAEGIGLRGWWRGFWDRRSAAGTSGEVAGPNGVPARPLRRAYLAVIGLMAVVDTVNVLSALHDAARRGQALAAWEPITWEATSGVAVLVACPIIFAALHAAPPGRRPWGATLLIHGVASLLFSALHIGLMMMLRIAIYGVLGFHYRVEAGAALYEYRKDLLAYLVLTGLIQLFAGRKPQIVAAVGAAAYSEPLPTTFDIIDGGRTVRVRPGEIQAVSSAGNYVEFHLADGRRLLMRATLRELEARLGPLGFERTHRSWLINAACVRELEPSGSGDYSLLLDGGVQAPLSRRFPSALIKLRQPEGG